MDARVPNESVADLHKALEKEKEKHRERTQSSASQDYGSTASNASSTIGRSRSEFFTRQATEEAASLKQPGGFRRDHLNKQATESGIPQEERPKAWQQSFLDRIRPLVRTGHFESVLGISLHPETGEAQALTQGETGTWHTVLALVKSFVGSGVTFLPNAFAHGGWFFSSVLLLCIASVNFACIRLLLDCKAEVNSSSYSDIAEKAAGRWGKLAVQISLVLSQFGVCVAYFCFVSVLAQSVHLIHGPLSIFSQLLVVVPLCLIRSVRHLEIPNLVADVLIMFGLGVVLYYDARSLTQNGITDTVVAFRPHQFGVCIGTLIFAFEGIPMILPIRNSMREPDKEFWPLFTYVFAGIAIFFWGFGIFCYLYLGTDTHTVILLNLPTNNLSLAVKIGYMLALLLSLPLMYLPAVRITEVWVFGVVHKEQHMVARSTFRAVQVGALAVAAFWGGQYFDKLLAFVGAVCAAPIAFIYPALFHLKLCAKDSTEIALDMGFIAFGVAAMVFTLKFL